MGTPKEVTLARDRQKFKETLINKLGGVCRICGRPYIGDVGDFRILEDYGYFEREVPHYTMWTAKMAEEFLPGFSCVCEPCLPEWPEFTLEEAGFHELINDRTLHQQMMDKLKKG